MYAWRNEDPQFAAEWSEAEETAADRLEEIAWKRAESGESDRMLEILLKGHRPKYRDKQSIDLTANVTVDHVAEAKQAVAELFGPTPHLIETKHG